MLFCSEASTQVAVQCMRPLNDDGSTDTTVLGFNFYRDGVLIHQTTGVNWAATTYTHTGLTTSQTYTLSVAAYSAAGVGTMSPTHAMTPPQAASGLRLQDQILSFWFWYSSVLVLS